MAPRPSRHIRFAALVLGGSLLVTACQGIIPGSQRDPPRLYELTPKSTFPGNLPTIRQQLIIETPHASSGLTSSRIAVKVRATTLDYYEKTEWTDLAPNLIQTLLIESFDNSKKIIAVGREGSGLRADYILKTELREFQAELFHGPSPVILVRLNVKLMRMPAREIVATRNFQARIKAKDRNIDSVISAFDTGLGRVLRRTVVWSLRTIDRNSRTRPGRRR